MGHFNVKDGVLCISLIAFFIGFTKIMSKKYRFTRTSGKAEMVTITADGMVSDWLMYRVTDPAHGIINTERDYCLVVP